MKIKKFVKSLNLDISNTGNTMVRISYHPGDTATIDEIKQYTDFDEHINAFPLSNVHSAEFNKILGDIKFEKWSICEIADVYGDHYTLITFYLFESHYKFFKNYSSETIPHKSV